MKIRYDTEEVQCTRRFVESLKEHMRVNMEMMKLHEPEFADCWSWGICEIDDMATNGLCFYYGGEDDKPEGFPEFTDVWVKDVEIY